MRFIIFTFLIFYCTILTAQVKFNGNLEQLDKNGKPVGWEFTFPNEKTYEAKLDSTVKFQGKYSLSMTSDSIAKYGLITSSIHQRLKGKTLMLVGAIKTETLLTAGPVYGLSFLIKIKR